MAKKQQQHCFHTFVQAAKKFIFELQFMLIAVSCSCAIDLRVSMNKHIKAN